MKLLIVEDDPIQGEMLKGFLEGQGYESLTAQTGAQALHQMEREPVWAVLLDHRLPDMNGDEVLARIKALNPMVRAIMITAYGDVDTAVKVMKLGAIDFLEKPVDLNGLLEKVQQMEQSAALMEDAAAVVSAVEQGPMPLKIIAQSEAMKGVLSFVHRVASSPWTVLIQGETGTGKELIAQLIHLLGPRKDEAFMAFNCAAVPEDLFESELFGHVKGAFTGATANRRGRFQVAHKGTLFLDEIGEMPSSLQPKLLRAIQERTIQPVGSDREIPVDVRLVCATNRDLRAMVERGQFREDLFYRIRVLEVELPPLRFRKPDIPPLLEFFLQRYAQGNRAFSPEALDIIVKYSFPGNVRELQHMVQRTLTLARGAMIRPQDLPEEIRHFRASTAGTLQEQVDALEREMLLAALEKSHWVQTQAAQQLGLSERVLRYKMKKHGIERQETTVHGLQHPGG